MKPQGSITQEQLNKLVESVSELQGLVLATITLNKEEAIELINYYQNKSYEAYDMVRGNRPKSMPISFEDTRLFIKRLLINIVEMIDDDQLKEQEQ